MSSSERSWEVGWELIEANLGSGGQGYTHVVRSKSSNEKAVIKELKHQEDPQARQRMRLEVVALRTLAEFGANVPAPIDDNLELVDEIDSPLFFVMQYVEGVTLDALVTKDGPLPLAEAIEITKRIGETIEIGHKQKLIHRDLKPKNIILNCDSDGKKVPYVLDYGISFNDSHDEELTRTAENFWNEFLSLPETNVQGDDRRDFRTDVTALCGLFFFCLTGRSPQLLLDSHGRQPHRRDDISLQKLLGGNPAFPMVDALLTRGFRPRVNDRYQSVEEFLKSLLAIESLANAPEPLTLTAVALRESQLLEMHDRTIQLEDLKKTVPKLLEKLASDLKGVTDNEELSRFRLKRIAESNLSTVENPLKLEWISDSYVLYRLTVASHPLLKEIAYKLGISGDSYCVIRMERKANPGGWEQASEFMRFPSDEDPMFMTVARDFKLWIARSMEALRIEVLRNAGVSVVNT